MITDLRQFAAEIKARAREIGFDLAGIAPAEPSRYRDYFRHWLDDGRAGTMDYLAKRFDQRTNPAVYLPNAASVICVAMNYHVALPSGADADPLSRYSGRGQGEGSRPDVSDNEESTAPAVAPAPCGGDAPVGTADFAAGPHGLALNPHPNPLPEYRERGNGFGRVARYALGDDYHEVFKPRLHALADWIRQVAPEAQTRAAVDTAPVMEKELAACAGVGWMGKNTCIINPSLGSWLFLGEIITTLPLPADQPAVDRCGACTRCIDACPTRAITAPYQLDARRCISYLTIEHRGEIDPEFQRQMGDWLYGCDICQDVCPWNGRAPTTAEPAFQPRFPGGRLDLEQVLNWNQEDYRSALRHSAMRRVKLPVLQRNAAIARGN